jgi:colanic acid biosynthesis glycosyl transferase WcaI
VKLTLINQYYPPDLAPTGHLAASLAEHRAELGDEVTVITSVGGYASAEDSTVLDEVTAARIVRIRASRLGRANLTRRVLDYLAFYAGALWHMSRLPSQDVVVALTTPPWIGWAGAVHKRQHPGAKLVIWSMDAYPEAAERFGTIQPGSAISRIARKVSHGLLTRADEVIVLDDAMKELITSNYALDRAGPPVTVISNWEPTSSYPADGSGSGWSPPSGLGIEEKFTVLYMGNAGRGHDFATVLEAARRLRSKAVVFLFVGGGPQWKALHQSRKEHGLSNLHLLDYVPKEMTASVMTGVDCALIVMRDEALGVVSPSKLHGYLAMGLPVIYVGPKGSNVDDAIESCDCGISLRHGDVNGLIRFITELAADPEQKRRIATRSRGAFEARYSDEVALAEYDRLLERLLAAG